MRIANCQYKLQRMVNMEYTAMRIAKSCQSEAEREWTRLVSKHGISDIYKAIVKHGYANSRESLYQWKRVPLKHLVLVSQAMRVPVPSLLPEAGVE